MLPDLLLFALNCGFRVFPCHPRSKVPCIKSWRKLASSDPAAIEKWARKYPDCNWAVATGPESGVFVLDEDGAAGSESLRLLEVQHGPLPATLTNLTGREDGGRHLCFRWPATGEVRNSAGQVGKGLDIRGAGGYIMIAPSIHPDTGQPYRWFDLQQTIAEAPAWFLDLLLKDKTAAPPRPHWQDSILSEGQRNDELTRHAGALRRKGAGLPELERKLLEANARRCVPPLEEREVLGIARSVARYPVGGLDPLEAAFAETKKEHHENWEAQCDDLSLQLQRARPGQPFALPLERIAEMICRHWTTIRGWRKKRVKEGFLIPAGEYIPHKRAGLYRVNLDHESLRVKGPRRSVAARAPLPSPVCSKELELSTNNPNYGLVGIRKFSPLEEIPEFPLEEIPLKEVPESEKFPLEEIWESVLEEMQKCPPR